MRTLFAACAATAVLAGCATGSDAVAQGGTFEFVAPGGQTDIFYDPPADRGTPGPLSGPDLMDTDKTISLDDFAGKVVVINVWGQWCGPCRTEITQLQQVYDATRDKGVAFLGIDVRDNNIDAPRDFIIDRGITFPSIYDPPMRTMIAFGGRYPDDGHPVDRGARPRAPGGRGVPARAARRGSATRRRTAGSGTMNLRPDRPVDRQRPAAAGAGPGGAGRAGVVRVAVRDPAGARLPVVPGRRGRRRREARLRPAPSRCGRRACGSRARRRCSWPGSPWCSCSAPSRCSA